MTLWANGMDKRDLSLSRCGDGYHLSGFLDIVTGRWSRPGWTPQQHPEAEDDRAPSQRRLYALGNLVAATLAHGMPTDRGIRPQLHVSVDADTLAGDPAGAPATLIGFGSIGAHLLGYLRCVSDTTAVLVHGETGGPTPQPNVLDVGRTSRLATAKQRTAVLARQRRVCVTPGCHHTHLEIHHSIWWSAGRATDLDNLVGLCTRCHHLVHQEKLTVTADGHGGFTFTRTSGATLVDDHRRQQGAVLHRLRA